MSTNAEPSQDAAARPSSWWETMAAVDGELRSAEASGAAEASEEATDAISPSFDRDNIDALVLHAQTRAMEGSKYAVRRLRRSGRVPVVVYGPLVDVDETLRLSIDAHEAELFLTKLGDAVKNTIFTLKIDGASGAEGEAVRVLVRNVQHHSVGGDLLNVEMVRFRPGHSYKVELPVEVVGAADNPALKGGGFVRHVLRTVPVTYNSLGFIGGQDAYETPSEEELARVAAEREELLRAQLADSSRVEQIPAKVTHSVLRHAVGASVFTDELDIPPVGVIRPRARSQFRAVLCTLVAGRRKKEPK